MFNARFYYPVFTILFLDFGLTLEQFALLNTVWAATIVLLEVPSGALADTLGRRNLVVLAAFFMVAEMLLILFAPMGESTTVFYLFLANRILSGAAESAASGADEALAYDTLKENGLEQRWGEVLEKQMRFQSLAFIVAMSTGAILYDGDLLNSAISSIGLNLEISRETATRLPIWGTLFLGIAAVITTLGMKETSPESADHNTWGTIQESTKNTIQAGIWILRTPMAFVIISCGMLFDHITRMIMTLTSELYRQFAIPEYSFGFIGSGLAILGTFMPKIGKAMVEKRCKGFNFATLSICVFSGLWLMARFTPYWSALPMVLVYGGIFLNGFFVSHYLNQITDSKSRATVLSFKGLCFNLAYGAIGYLYASTSSIIRETGEIQSVAESSKSDALFQTVFGYAPYYFLVLVALVAAVSSYRLKVESPSKAS
nr:MFS transporter [Pelagicoccus albus]